MKELLSICKEQGLSFILFLDNHKRFGLSVQEYFDTFKPDGFQDEMGQREIATYAEADSWAMIEVFDHSKVGRFACYDLEVETCANLTHLAILQKLFVDL